MMICTNKNIAVPELNVHRKSSLSAEDNSGKQAQMLAGFFQVLKYAISSEEISTIFKTLNVFTFQRRYSGLHLMCGIGYTILTEFLFSQFFQKNKSK